MHGTGDVKAKDTAMLLRKTGLKTKGLDASASDKSLEEERQTFTREGKKEHGFTSSVVPTIEEKLIAEQLKKDRDAHALKSGQNGSADPSHEDSTQQQRGNAKHAQNGDARTVQAGDAKQAADGDIDHGQASAKVNRPPQVSLRDGPSQAHAGDELFGTPANADPKRDDKVPGTRSDGTDTEDEERAPDARSDIRKHLSTKTSSSKAWTLPTPSPHVDPQGFEDPVCDAFWKSTWLACAVHNASAQVSAFCRIY